MDIDTKQISDIGGEVLDKLGELCQLVWKLRLRSVISKNEAEKAEMLNVILEIEKDVELMEAKFLNKTIS